MSANFKCKSNDRYLIGVIAHRAVQLVVDQGGEANFALSDLCMDLTFCHSVCPLDLQGLAGADDANFAHDVFGIVEHLNRATGKLNRRFRPRFARKEGNMKADIRRPWGYKSCKIVPVDCPHHAKQLLQPWPGLVVGGKRGELLSPYPRDFGDGVCRNRYWRIEFPDESWVWTATKRAAKWYIDHQPPRRFVP